MQHIWLSTQSRNQEDLGVVDNEEEEIQYGVCRARQVTSIQYQDLISFSPAQIMEQEVYYTSAVDAIEICIHIALVIFHLFIMYNHLEKLSTIG